MSTKPTHEQAELHLKVYDLRREAKLRQGREWFFKNYFVENVEDARRIAAPGTENGALAMMVITYWEHACALLNYELLHEDLFFETSGEFFGVWERIKAVVPQFRQALRESAISRALGEGCAALRNVERKPHTRPHRGHAPNDEADGESTVGHGDGQSVSSIVRARR